MRSKCFRSVCRSFGFDYLICYFSLLLLLLLWWWWNNGELWWHCEMYQEMPIALGWCEYIAAQIIRSVGFFQLLFVDIWCLSLFAHSFRGAHIPIWFVSFFTMTFIFRHSDTTIFLSIFVVSLFSACNSNTFFFSMAIEIS